MFSDKELNDITVQLYDRGMFGWLYDTLINIANNDVTNILSEKTDLIIQAKKQFDVKTMEELSYI